MQVADPIAESRKTAAFSYLQGLPQYVRNSDRGSFTRAGKNGELLKGNLEVAKTLALERDCCALFLVRALVFHNKFDAHHLLSRVLVQHRDILPRHIF